MKRFSLRKEIEEIETELGYGSSVPPGRPERSPVAQKLKDLLNQKKTLALAGNDTTAIVGQILDVRRQLRKGPVLQKGDFLLDGRFELVEMLGKGGFATVWKAWDDQKEMLVALKVLHGQHGDDRSRRERFFRGARKMADLQHQNIVAVLEAEHHDSDEGWYFFVMEYVGGGDLAEAVRNGTLAGEARLRVLQQVGEGLSYAHKKGLVHRDVKPANILLDKEGNAKLTDFDLVRAEDTTGLTRAQTGMGTLQFAAPEALGSAGDADARADVYSFASTVVFTLLDGKMPPTYYRAPDRCIGGLFCSGELRQVLNKATAFEVEERYDSVKEFTEAFVEVWPGG